MASFTGTASILPPSSVSENSSLTGLWLDMETINFGTAGANLIVERGCVCQNPIALSTKSDKLRGNKRGKLWLCQNEVSVALPAWGLNPSCPHIPGLLGTYAYVRQRLKRAWWDENGKILNVLPNPCRDWLAQSSRSLMGSKCLRKLSAQILTDH